MRLCGFEVGLNRPLFLIAGPCVVESEQLQIDVAGQLKEICAALRAMVRAQPCSSWVSKLSPPTRYRAARRARVRLLHKALL